MIQQRRSRRVLLRIPVSLSVGTNRPVPGVTAVVNRHGTLVSSRIQCEDGAIVRIQNELSLESTLCRVVYAGPADSGSERRLGVEFIEMVPTFWGNEYEEALVMDIAQHGDLESDGVA